ncbi:MAG: hypothetical protein PHE53_00515 [Thermoguttaceae bacterium]|nr:hypothetical protein [Thermoguttaceae bacterium]
MQISRLSPIFVGFLILLLSTSLLTPMPESIASQTPDEIVPPTKHLSYSGIYPHLAYFNNENECGTGAVVPWADRLWVMTYGPHLPNGSSDKLYEIDRSLNVTIRPESIGGTPANRMIHRETNQLLMGPYLIASDRSIRTIPYSTMPGRLTGCARHLFEPATKVYYATMEEGIYEVTLDSLNVTEIYPDDNNGQKREFDILPGYHGKGFYSGQHRAIYSNNGERSAEALTRPEIASGALGEWDGVERVSAPDAQGGTGGWRVVLRNQCCEVTGPGGIYGNANPLTDPIWTTGWDHRSVLLMVLDHGQWTKYRLPKASHCYDGAHGWNTEWPRIRSITAQRESAKSSGRTAENLLMTMHGMFWNFPNTFDTTHAAGIRPRSTYLKVIGDFACWDDSEASQDGKTLVFGCDDAARSEFLNQRKYKGSIIGPGQSQSNLWFVTPEQLDHLGPPLGCGGVWWNESVAADMPSDSFLFAGFDLRGLHLAHSADTPATITMEVDRLGDDVWTPLRSVIVPAHSYVWVEFPPNEVGEWIRLRTDRELPTASAIFAYRAKDERTTEANPIFDGIAALPSTDFSAGVIRARGGDLRTLHFAATTYQAGQPTEEAYYELDASMRLRRVDDVAAFDYLRRNMAIPTGLLQVDAGGVLMVDNEGHRFRLPKANVSPTEEVVWNQTPMRADREVCTERDLLNVAGLFYELPAENAGGLIRIRPITTHARKIVDYASYRGMLILSGVDAAADPTSNAHLIRSDDGCVTLWAGAVDDLWQFGKPTGHGGPWQQTAVQAGETSDPFLMNGFDRKRLTLTRHATDDPIADAKLITVTLEVDIDGNGHFQRYENVKLPVDTPVEKVFPEAFSAYWIRCVTSDAATLTTEFQYF